MDEFNDTLLKLLRKMVKTERQYLGARAVAGPMVGKRYRLRLHTPNGFARGTTKDVWVLEEQKITTAGTWGWFTVAQDRYQARHLDLIKRAVGLDAWLADPKAHYDVV